MKYRHGFDGLLQGQYKYDAAEVQMGNFVRMGRYGMGSVRPPGRTSLRDFALSFAACFQGEYVWAMTVMAST